MGSLSIWHLVVLLLMGGVIVLLATLFRRVKSARWTLALRVANGAIWVTAWMATAVRVDSFDDPSRMLGQAIIPAVLWLILDLSLRRKPIGPPL
jgi:hypothetical protein